MHVEQLRNEWLREECSAQIHGWDFFHIQGRYAEESGLPWDYAGIVREYLTDSIRLLDCDTGGGEFLLSLRHPYGNTAATEGYPPNVALCQETLTPLGIDFRACADPTAVPFPDAAFDLVINRHGSFHAPELFRLLRDGGLFITEQVGCDNDRDLVKMVLPEAEKPYPNMNLATQRGVFEAAGFQILRAEEAYGPIAFYDVGAFVWFARVIEWEFPCFSVERCFPKLLEMQRQLERCGRIQGTVHRYLIVAGK